MDSSDRSIIITLLVIPFAGLLYCGLVIGSMLSFPVLREHPLLSGGVAALIPLTTGALIWLSASARAYRR
ncbi:MAG: hypothetical protein AAGF01_14315 [Cyanobacteria bacterium P01_G01_bin.38]